MENLVKLTLMGYIYIYECISNYLKSMSFYSLLALQSDLGKHLSHKNFELGADNEGQMEQIAFVKQFADE